MNDGRFDVDYHIDEEVLDTEIIHFILHRSWRMPSSTVLWRLEGQSTTFTLGLAGSKGHETYRQR